ncbi:MAG: outer membrane beta-barrel protein [Myxococcales bacterium]|nr:outer membrane beta-barrel protein [Myxococcales bacterium]
MGHRIAALCLWTLLFFTAVAQAKDFKMNTAAEGGYLWLFAYDRHASHIDIDPAPAFGGTLFQLFDFNWARNMVGEINYIYCAARGEAFSWDDEKEKVTDGDDSTLFDIAMHHAAFNPGYVFEGRRLHPYISGGLGATYLIFQPIEGKKKDEVDFTINLGAGADYTIWETGQAALERLDLGLRVRYYYIFQKDIVDAAMNGVSVTLRLNLRW